MENHNQLQPQHSAPHGAMERRTDPNMNVGTVAIEEQRVSTEVQAMVFMAKTYPRNIFDVKERINRDCSQVSVAEKATYAYSRGGTNVTGPSIRLAEVIARAMGNLEFGVKELARSQSVSEMQAFSWDLETNTRSSQNFQVRHERHTKQGVKPLTDPRDIYEATANEGGRRLRARLLAIIPPDLVEYALGVCNATLAGYISQDLKGGISKMLEAFRPYGVSRSQIEAKVGKPLDTFFPEDLVQLRSIYNALAANTAKPSDFFSAKSETAVNSINAAAKQMQQREVI